MRKPYPMTHTLAELRPIYAQTTMSVLDVLADATAPLTPTQVGDACGLDSTITRVILTRLVQRDLAVKVFRGQYELAAGVTK